MPRNPIENKPKSMILDSIEKPKPKLKSNFDISSFFKGP